MDLCPDQETGEITHTCIYNNETGEEEFTFSTDPTTDRTTPFKVPKVYYTIPEKEQHPGRKLKTEYKSTDFAAILFLLPTTVLFYPILAIIVLAIEVILHTYAHRKNKRTTNKNMYYQSPLHVICKEFCGYCREEESKIKITQIQEKRADKIRRSLEYVRRIVSN